MNLKNRLTLVWKVAVAICMLWLHGEAWGVELSDLPIWRQAAGFVFILVFVEYLDSANRVSE